MDEEQQRDWLEALAVSCKRVMERTVWYSYYELITIGAISQLGSLNIWVIAGMLRHGEHNGLLFSSEVWVTKGHP